MQLDHESKRGTKQSRYSIIHGNINLLTQNGILIL